jgi:hypothetical protein
MGDTRGHEATRDNSRTREAAQAVQADLALLIGLAVALAVFCCVSLASIRLIRRKGRSSQSIYNMSSLHCRSEFLEKTELGPKRETHFSFPGARRVQAEDKQVLQLDFPTSATSSPHPGEFRKSGGEGRSLKPDEVRSLKPEDHQGLKAEEHRRRAGALPLASPARSEHQYDVPFSHLLPRWVILVGKCEVMDEDKDDTSLTSFSL